MPVRNNPTDSGFDVHAIEDCEVPIGSTVLIKTGLAVQVSPIFDTDERKLSDNYNIPGGWTLGLFAWDKSGLGLKGLKTGGGVIDNPYTGEIGVIFTNVGGVGLFLVGLAHLMTSITSLGVIGQSLKNMLTGTYKFKKGDKLCNLIVQRVELPIVEEAEALVATSRGADGYGSSGN